MKRLFYRLPLLYLVWVCLIGVTFFWGYCWNWWGQAVLWDYLFQPICPPASDEARYPHNIDVLVSARYAPKGGFSIPSTRAMHYMTQKGTKVHHHLYDFEFNQIYQVNIPTDVSPVFITGQWILIENDRGNKVLLNIETSKQIIPTELTLESKLTEEIPHEVLTILQGEVSVYIKNGFLMVLPRPTDNLSTNGYLVRGNDNDHPTKAASQISEKFHTLSIESINLDSNRSHDGRFYYGAISYYRPHVTAAIYHSDSQTPTSISSLSNFGATGWAYGHQGVILQSGVPTFLIGGPSIVVGTPALFPIPQPILLLRQDSQYLPPDLQAQFAAQDALEARNKTIADSVMVFLMGATMGVIAFTARTHLHRHHAEQPVSPRRSF
jgi:hypothetical protein